MLKMLSITYDPCTQKSVSKPMYIVNKWIGLCVYVDMPEAEH